MATRWMQRVNPCAQAKRNKETAAQVTQQTIHDSIRYVLTIALRKGSHDCGYGDLNENEKISSCALAVAGTMGVVGRKEENKHNFDQRGSDDRHDRAGQGWVG